MTWVSNYERKRKEQEEELARRLKEWAKRQEAKKQVNVQHTSK